MEESLCAVNTCRLITLLDIVVFGQTDRQTFSAKTDKNTSNKIICLGCFAGYADNV